VIAACLKRVDRWPQVDPLTGEVRTDGRSAGASDADGAALEWALRLGEAWGHDVLAATAGPRAAEGVLREARAAGAHRAVRADVPADAPSAPVAAALAGAVGDAAVVVCGNGSLDRGSGSVPAFLAHRLGAASALGLLTLDADAGAPGVVRAERRLDGGRRERLRVAAPAVLSVEAGAARLRRAPLGRLLAAAVEPVEVVAGPDDAVAPTPARVRPFRPRPRVLPPPPAGLTARERVLALTGALVERTPPRTLVLPPAEAADALLEQLRAWGELP
jgi:electron transfer flavoprotein beta subunit